MWDCHLEKKVYIGGKYSSHRTNRANSDEKFADQKKNTLYDFQSFIYRKGWGLNFSAMVDFFGTMGLLRVIFSSGGKEPRLFWFSDSLGTYITTLEVRCLGFLMFAEKCFFFQFVQLLVLSRCVTNVTIVCCLITKLKRSDYR